jgi:hypothetical protein
MNGIGITILGYSRFGACVQIVEGQHVAAVFGGRRCERQELYLCLAA